MTLAGRIPLVFLLVTKTDKRITVALLQTTPLQPLYCVAAVLIAFVSTIIREC